MAPVLALLFSTVLVIDGNGAVDRNLLQSNWTYLDRLCVSFEESVCSTTWNMINIHQSIGETVLLYIYGWNEFNEQLYIEEYDINISSNFINSRIITTSNIDHYIAIINIPNNDYYLNNYNDTDYYISIYDPYNISIHYDIHYTFIHNHYICNFHYYSLDNTQCKICPNYYNCYGGDDIYIERDYYSNYYALNITNITTSNNSHTNDDILLSALCPPNYCCSQYKCSIYDINTICALNRNPAIPLCGACNDGYTELYGIYYAECGKCTGSASMVLVLFGVFYIFFILNFMKQNLRIYGAKNKEIQKRLLIKSQHPLIFYVTNSMLYFYQILIFITYNNIIQVSLPLTEIFMNLSFISRGCISSSLSGRNKAAITLFAPTTIIIIMLLLNYTYIIIKFKVTVQPNNNKKNMMKALSATTFKILSILYVTILFSFYKLSICVKYDNMSIMKYAGNVECYDAVHLLTIIMIVFLIILLPFIVWIIQRRKPEFIPLSITSLYRKEMCWFIPFDIFKKGIIITFALLQITSNPTNNVIITSLLCGIILIWNLYYLPFRFSIHNKLEIFILSLLLFISILSINSNNDPILSIMAALSFIPLIPIPYLLYLFVKDSMPFIIIIEKIDIDSDQRPEYDDIAFKILVLPSGHYLKLYKKIDFYHVNNEENQENEDNEEDELEQSDDKEDEMNDLNERFGAKYEYFSNINKHSKPDKSDKQNNNNNNAEIQLQESHQTNNL